jgi:cysteinyl-tRNA synthetase
MAAAHLGETIDIHAGGNDLLFPHHENEVAQSTCAHGGKTFARYWLHNGMLTFDGAKMSKSIGNVKQLHALLGKFPPEALRYALLSAHYRQPLDWSDALIEQSIATLDRLYGTLRDLATFDVEPAISTRDVDEALEDDLNTPQALAALNGLAFEARHLLEHEARPLSNNAIAGLRRIKADLLASAELLGLLQQDPEAWFKRGSENVDSARVENLIEARRAAREARDFARADAIRAELAAMGVAIEDGADGTRWKIAN